MGIDELITLDDGSTYILLLKSSLNEDNYFLASLAENGEPTDNYVVLKEIIENGEISVEEITDKEILIKLSDDFDKQVENIED